MSKKIVTHKNSNAKPSDAELLSEYKLYFEQSIGMPRIAKKLNINLAELRKRVRDAYKNNAIVIKAPKSEDWANTLSEKWPGVTYHVLNAIGEHFFVAALKCSSKNCGRCYRNVTLRSLCG